MRTLSTWLPVFALAAAAAAQSPQVTFAGLLAETTELERLTRLPAPAYRTVQFGSSDRRSTGIEQPGWFSNADGFGQEPIPGFEQVLQVPGADGVGEYLLCDVDGPGAIVRGWSAGMDGVLRVWLDGAERPLFEGRAYDFLARRSTALAPRLDAARRAFFQQQDADYLPIPFGKHLRISWRGSVRQLHFYHVQVRCYAAGTTVQTFTPGDVEALSAWTPPDLAAVPAGGERSAFRLEPGKTFTVTKTAPAGERRVLRVHSPDALERDPDGGVREPKGDGLHVFPAGAQLRWLAVRLDPATSGAQLRAVVLRVFVDDSQVPQVEVPLGDFFGTFAGVHPCASLPLLVTADGTLLSRWPMPYGKSLRIELANTGPTALAGELATEHGELAAGFDDRALCFHATWRVDHELTARAAQAPIDLPYLMAIGQGRFVGVGCQIVNPPMDPRWRSNWWGEGDEKIFVDGRLDALGTGSEDFFNYSWSHWNYFSHAYCSQPLTTGPGNCGYVSNARYQIVDDLPFAQSLAVALELWTHKPVSPLSYARTAYFYARPGVVTDHRAVQPAELRVPALLPWPDGALSIQADAATWRPGSGSSGFATSTGTVEPAVADAWTRSGAVLRWQAPAGGRIDFPFTVVRDGVYTLRAACQQRPDAPDVQLLVDGRLQRNGEQDTFPLRCRHGCRFEDLVLDNVALAAGAHTLSFACPQGGAVAVDLLGYERRGDGPKAIPGAVEAELWDLVACSDGTEVEVQGMGSNDWSMTFQRWVKARKVGDFAAFRVAAPTPGRYRVALRLTHSWDFGILRVDWNGTEAAKDLDTFGGEAHRLSVHEVDLGERDLTSPAELRFTVTGSNGKAQAPGTYFGIDCVVLRAK